jgi:ketopantoate reductase
LFRQQLHCWRAAVQLPPYLVVLQYFLASLKVLLYSCAESQRMAFLLQRSEMKILIVGTGVIGVNYGWALSQVGNEVTHFVRPGRQGEFERGIHLDIIDERKGHKKHNILDYAIRCTETITPSDDYEFILLPIHFYQVEEALQRLVPLAGNAIFLGFGSNWDGIEGIEKHIPRERFLLGFPYGGGDIQNGTYVTYLGPKVYLGQVDGKQTQPLEQVASLFAKADLKPDVPDNILHLIWTSHAGAVGLAAGIAKAGGVAPFLRDRDLMTECHAVVRELYELCRLRGVEPYRYLDFAFLWIVPAWLFIPVLRTFSAYNPGVPRALAHAVRPAQDTGAIYTAMIKTADELRLDMPRAKAMSPYLQIE